jgi:hypothetical protein
MGVRRPAAVTLMIRSRPCFYGASPQKITFFLKTRFNSFGGTILTNDFEVSFPRRTRWAFSEPG